MSGGIARAGRFVYRKGARSEPSGVTGLGLGFAAIFGVIVGIAVAGAARDDAAGAAEAAGFGVGGVTLDAAHAAIFRVVREHGFAVVGGVAVAVGGARSAILEAPNGIGIGRVDDDVFEVRGFARAVCGNGHRNARGATSQSPQKTDRGQRGQQSDTVLHPPLTREARGGLGGLRKISGRKIARAFAAGAGVG